MCKTRVRRFTSHAFSRLELLACIFGCGLVLSVILPGLANSTARSDRGVCFNNLRQIGVAYSNFGLEHDGQPPWLVTMNSGGNTNHPLKQNLYVQFSAISNYLATPGLLVDPADQRRNLNPATHWDATAGGLWNPAHQNNSVSYFLGIDGTFRMPRAVLSGDRNIEAPPRPGSCPWGIEPCYQVHWATTHWTNDVHGATGNLLFYDGSVDQTDTERLREAFRSGAGLLFSGNSRVLMTFY
jgi:prepilin-type processing-associated H-X9-DG protein